jgi:predicted lipoprotein with Yx(FWY)xxD motif
MMRPSPRSLSLPSLAVGLAFVAAACSSAAATPSTSVLGASAAASVTLSQSSSASLGVYLTGQNGMTLYVLTKDTPDTSTCSGSCATAWPPLVVAPGATITGPVQATDQFGTIHRADGTTQVTYNHMPLYYYSGDSVAGDTNGQGVNGVWFVAPVSGMLSSSAPSAMASEAPSAMASEAPSAMASPAAAASSPASGY